MDIGKEIRRLRNARGLTQEALASALNVTAQTVSKWECGGSMPDIQMLPEIAVYFGITIDSLFAMSPEKQLERIENHIYDSALIDEADMRQIRQQLADISEMPGYEGQAKTVLTKLYNHQAEQYRSMAVDVGKEAVRITEGSGDAISELANAWGSYIPDWNVRNHHALIEWLGDYCSKAPENRPAVMWLLDNLIDDRRLDEAREWLDRFACIDHSFRIPMYWYLIASAAEDNAAAERYLGELGSMEDDEWCRAVVLGDIYTMRQEYDTAVAWYRKGQDMQSSPKFTDSAISIAHICEIRGEKASAIEAYREAIRLLREEWGVVSGEMIDSFERSIYRLRS